MLAGYFLATYNYAFVRTLRGCPHRAFQRGAGSITALRKARAVRRVAHRRAKLAIQLSGATGRVSDPS